MKTTPRAHIYALSLLRCYPRAWRARYEEEAIAVLEERPATLRTLFDLLLGMLDAYLHAHLFTERKFVIMQQARNSQLNIFSAFALCTPLLVLYILLGPRALPGWDLKSPVDGSSILPHTVLVLQLVLASVFCALVASLIGAGAFIKSTLKEVFAGKQKQALRAFRWNLLSFLPLALALCLCAGSLLLRSSYAGLFFSAASLLLLAFLLFQFISNLLRLRQGMREKTLSWRFMQPTLLPGLLAMLVLVLTYLVITQQFFFLLMPLGNYLSINPSIFFDVLLALAASILASLIIGGVVYLKRKLQRTTFAPDFLRRTLFSAMLTTLAMIVMLAVMLYHTWVVDTSVNALGWTLRSVPLLNIISCCVAIATVASCMSCWRAFSAQRALAPA